MISLEIAKDLKYAGLEWEPALLDCFVINECDIEGVDPNMVCVIRNSADIAEHKKLSHTWYPRRLDVVWIPRLDQLLEEVDKHWATTCAQGWKLRLKRFRLWVRGVDGSIILVGETLGETTEEAVAKALLKVLLEKAGGQCVEKGVCGV